MLGKWYAAGNYVTKNPETARYWLRLASAKGNMEAQRQLAELG